MTLNTAMKTETFTTTLNPTAVILRFPIMASLKIAAVEAERCKQEEIDCMAFTHKPGTLIRGRSKFPSGRGERKLSVDGYSSKYDMAWKYEERRFNRPLVNSRIPSIDEGMDDYLLEIAELKAETAERDSSWTDAEAYDYFESHNMLVDEEVGDVVVLKDTNIIDKLISSLNWEDRLSEYDAQMEAEYAEYKPEIFDEDKEWADYQARKAGKDTADESENGSFDDEDYQDDEDAGHYISTSSPEFLRSACCDEDGDIHIENDDSAFYIRQECGSVFEDEECHVPPVIESRFDILGGAAIRNLYNSNSKWAGLTGQNVF